MMAFPIVFVSLFGAIIGILARLYGLLTGKSDDEILEMWGAEM